MARDLYAFLNLIGCARRDLENAAGLCLSDANDEQRIDVRCAVGDLDDALDELMRSFGLARDPSIPHRLIEVDAT